MQSSFPIKNNNIREIQQSTLMKRPSLQTLSVELVYRILDKLDEIDLIYSISNVSARLNMIMDTYHRYQVS